MNSHQFIFKVLQLVSEGQGNYQKVDVFLKSFLEKINEDLVEDFPNITQYLLKDKPTETQRFIARTLLNFSAYISQFLLGNRAINLELARVSCTKASDTFISNKLPVDWAKAQNNLGNIYAERILGERTDNIEKAIQCHQNALKIKSQGYYPIAWSRAQINLGSAYLDRIKGHRDDNIEQAIECYNNALKIYKSGDFPEEWAIAKCGLGNSYCQRIKGTHTENIKLAIKCYQEVLYLDIGLISNELIAKAKNQLGSAYLESAQENRSEDIEKAIKLYESALCIYKYETVPKHWAAINHNLGEAYYARIQGKRIDNLELAIKYYEEALTIRKEDTFSIDWATTCNSLANIYCIRIKGKRADNLELAIKYYKEVLKVRRMEAFPMDWATTCNGLGDAYYIRIRGNRTDNLEAAIKAYRDALSVRRRKVFPIDWATTLNNLANVYRDRIKGDRAMNLEFAIKRYKAALTIRTRDSSPVDWAQTQNNLAIAYYTRIRGDRDTNIERAIERYENALEVRTPDNFPVEWAATKHNLATAYYARIEGQHAANLEFAIECYGEALEVRTYEDFPVDWAQTQNNLANAFFDRIEGDRETDLKKAIEGYQNALKVRTHEDFPVDWAQTQNNLGNAYSERIRSELFEGDTDVGIKQAIEHYEEALKVYTPNEFPIDWATTRYNLANTYAEDAKDENSPNFELAIKCYQDALTKLTPSANPYDAFKAAYGLGKLYFTVNKWKKALEYGYKKAIEAVEQIRTWAITGKRRQDILESTMVIYGNAIQCHIELGKKIEKGDDDGQPETLTYNRQTANDHYQKAMLLTERARARHLVDLIHNNKIHQDVASSTSIHPELKQDLDDYEKLRHEIEQLQFQQSREERSNDETTRTETVQNAENMSRLQNQKQKIWQRIRFQDEVLANGLEVPQLNFEKLAGLIADQQDTAIVSFYSTDDHTYVFIVRHDSSGNITCQPYSCLGQGSLTMQNWIVQNWLIPYHTLFKSWKDAIPDLLAEIANRLDINVLARHLNGIKELILIPHLMLHQIPFAALPIDDETCLGDRFCLRTLPSAQILKYCSDRESKYMCVPGCARNVLGDHFGTIEDAESNLPIVFAGFEPVAQYLKIPTNQRLRQTEATVDNYRALAQSNTTQVLHSIHHAKSSLGSPMESALSLANGRITLGQLLSPNWRMPNLVDVFLACCETNLGTPTLTDDLLTLSTGFLCAGARSVVSTLWSVDALATVLFCEFYYEFRYKILEDGDHRQQSCDNRPTALQKAQQKLRQAKRGDIKPKIDDYFRQAHTMLKEQHTDGKLDQQQYKECSKELVRKHDNYVSFLSKSRLPFESPYFWAGFVSSGMR